MWNFFDIFLHAHFFYFLKSVPQAMTTPPPAYVEIVARRSTYVHIVTLWVFFFQVLIYFYFLEAAFAIYMHIYVTTTKVLFFIAQIAARTSTYVHIVPLWFSFCDFFVWKSPLLLSKVLSSTYVCTNLNQSNLNERDLSQTILNQTNCATKKKLN